MATGQTSEARAAAFERFSALMWGLAGTQCLYVVAKLRVADALVGGPRPVAEVAREVGADPDALERILRAARGDGRLYAAGDRRRRPHRRW